MKRIIAAVLCLLTVLSLTGCGIAGLIADSKDASDYGSDMTPEEIYQDIRDKLDAEKLVAFNFQIHTDLEEDVISLSADLKNKYIEKVSDVTVAFAAWDIDGNPIKLKSASGITEDSYIKEVGFGEISLEADEIWRADKGDVVTGFKVDKSQTDIAYISAVAISFKKADGGIWNNPYYEAWKESYNNIKLEDYMKLKSVYDNLVPDSEK